MISRIQISFFFLSCMFDVVLLPAVGEAQLLAKPITWSKNNGSSSITTESGCFTIVISPLRHFFFVVVVIVVVAIAVSAACWITPIEAAGVQEVVARLEVKLKVQEAPGHISEVTENTFFFWLCWQGSEKLARKWRLKSQWQSDR